MEMMNDETKDAIEMWRETAKKTCRCLDCAAVRAILAHLDGEPLRQAKALEAVREELTRALREIELETARAEKAEAQVDPLVMQAASFAVHGALGWGFDPNTVSPASLARAAESLAQEFMTMRARAEKAELDYRGVVENFDLDSLNKAINDARARVAELEAQLGGMTEQWKAELNHANAWMRKHRAAEAQVAAARKFIEDDTCRHDEEKRAVLRAMDEAAK